MPKIYVGTYEKYSECNLFGAWVDLDDFETKDDFIEHCLELHADEEDPELFFQDFEGIPRYFISECSIDSEFWDYMNYDDGHDGDAKEAYVNLFNEWDSNDFEERLYGRFDSDTDLAYGYVENTGVLDGVPSYLQNYFDYEKFGRDLAMDFSEDCGYYFRS